MMPLWGSTMAMALDQVWGGFRMHHRTLMQPVEGNLTGIGTSPISKSFLLLISTFLELNAEQKAPICCIPPLTLTTVLKDTICSGYFTEDYVVLWSVL